MKHRIFKVSFQGRLGAERGVWKNISNDLTILADSEEEARRKLLDNLKFELARVTDVKEIELS